MTLCMFLERGVDPALGTRLHRAMVERPVFHRLSPPSHRGDKTVVDMPTTGSANAAADAAYAWGAAAWSAWSAHHDTVRSWLGASGL